MAKRKQQPEGKERLLYCSGPNWEGDGSKDDSACQHGESMVLTAPRYKCCYCTNKIGPGDIWTNRPDKIESRDSHVAAVGSHNVKSGKNREPCPECGGRPWYSDYQHKDNCSRNSVEEKKAHKPPCERCGGPAKGRGWSHKPDCTLNTVVVRENKPPCEHCGGPSRGKGHTHSDDCPVLLDRQEKIKTAAKEKYLAKKGSTGETKPPCEHCGGPAKGRGWSHKPDCKILQERASVITTRVSGGGKKVLRRKKVRRRMGLE